MRRLAIIALVATLALTAGACKRKRKPQVKVELTVTARLPPLAVVAVNREWNPRTVSVPLPTSLTLPDGTTLKDRLGGPTLTVANRTLPLTIAAHSSAVLAP